MKGEGEKREGESKTRGAGGKGTWEGRIERGRGNKMERANKQRGRGDGERGRSKKVDKLRAGGADKQGQERKEEAGM